MSSHAKVRGASDVKFGDGPVLVLRRLSTVFTELKVMRAGALHANAVRFSWKSKRNFH